MPSPTLPPCCPSNRHPYCWYYQAGHQSHTTSESPLNLGLRSHRQWPQEKARREAPHGVGEGQEFPPPTTPWGPTPGPNRAQETPQARAPTPWPRPLVVREDHRVRHLRDGGGLPSPGNLSLSDRPTPRLLRVGELLQCISAAKGLRKCVDQLYLKKEGNPFSEEVIHEATVAVGHCLGLDASAATLVAPTVASSASKMRNQ